jgi:ferrous iron transport protein A
MSEVISLAEMKPGTTGKISQIRGGFGVGKNLENMGIRINTKIKKISQQAMGGPVVVQVGNTQVAMGYGMANKVLVEIN